MSPRNRVTRQPLVEWLIHEDIGRLLATQCQAGPGDLLMIPTAANGQAAFGVYHRDHQGTFEAVAL
ncbi:hypothetical protein F7O44_23485 [Phytoactinopolyspora sp. XMNu-373]|uniref:Uncharacterized protein n=1 Tax=Phytoactinopolyspora mesophila TaxID=2650750 RepID=A0A7K3MAP1_9ACTN|nr:hypothetical protein [Phytoactinopolyspora mesophila]